MNDPMIGQSIGHYQVTACIGAGGMGEVYRATDTKLHRDVALKVLPDAFARDAERMARFQREAQVLASLNHRNIAIIHGLEETESTRALAMELVEGPTLADRIAQGPLPLEEALPIARQIAEALEYAHERSIIHRDLKPANIKVTHDGTVKVLDFGLAKAVEGERARGDAAHSPTLSIAVTEAGWILGTAAYMSPEQAKGKQVDRRGDIWAFGVVLFEMLTGRRAFPTEDVSETLAAVLRDEPNWQDLPRTVPPGVRELLRRCLKKDPRSRLRDVGDARVVIEEEIGGPSQPEPAVSTAASPRSVWPTVFAAIAAVVSTILAIALWVSRQPAAVHHVTRFVVTPPAGRPLAFEDVPILSISSDGRQVVFQVDESDSGRRVLYVRSFDRVDPVRMAGTEGASGPFFSPDGKWIGFFADGKLKKISVAGGAAFPLADAPRFRGGAWGHDDTIVFSPEFNGGLLRIAGAGGTPDVLTKPDSARGERTHRWPDILPNGKAVLFTIGSINSPGNYDDARIAAYIFETKQTKILVKGGNMARFVRPDYLIYARAGVLFGVRFDPERLEVHGSPVALLENVGGDPSSGAAYFSVASDGTLAQIPGAKTASGFLLTLVNRKGEATDVPLSARGFFYPRFSPDGRRIAFTVGTGTIAGNGDIWTYDLRNGSLARLTFGDTSVYPLWSPDGRRIAFTCQASGGGICAKLADGSGGETRLRKEEGMVPESWSADGATVIYTRFGSQQDIYVLPLASPEKPELFEATASAPQFSPDGKWIAYMSYESGLDNVYVRSFPAGGGKWQVSPDGGGYPKWLKDGSALFYIHSGQVLRVDVRTQPSFQAGPPQVLFGGLEGNYFVRTAPLVNYDVSPDGQRFIFVKRGTDSPVSKEILMTLNWSEELRRPLAKEGR